MLKIGYFSSKNIKDIKWELFHHFNRLILKNIIQNSFKIIKVLKFAHYSLAMIPARDFNLKNVLNFFIYLIKFRKWF